MKNMKIPYIDLPYRNKLEVLRSYLVYNTILDSQIQKISYDLSMEINLPKNWFEDVLINGYLALEIIESGYNKLDPSTLVLKIDNKWVQFPGTDLERFFENHQIIYISYDDNTNYFSLVDQIYRNFLVEEFEFIKNHLLTRFQEFFKEDIRDFKLNKILL